MTTKRILDMIENGEMLAQEAVMIGDNDFQIFDNVNGRFLNGTFEDQNTIQETIEKNIRVPLLTNSE